MAKKAVVNELMEVTGIRDFAKLSPADSANILRLVGERRLQEPHINALFELAPSFPQLSTQTLASVLAAIESAKAAQSEGMAILRGAVEGIGGSLRVLSENAESDEARVKLAECVLQAGTLYVALAGIAAKMNTSNNATWQTIALAALSAFSVVLSAFALSRSGGRSDKA